MTKRDRIKNALMVIGIVAITMVIAQTLFILVKLPIIIIVGVASLVACIVVWFFGKLFEEDIEAFELPDTEAAQDSTTADPALNTQHDFTQSALDALTDPILVIDTERRLVFTNRAAQNRFNFTNVGIRLETLIRFPQLLEAIDKIALNLEPVDIVWESHIPSHRFDRVNITAFQVETGVLIAITLSDETALRIAEQTRADFLANAGHELRTPLASIRGFIETLQDTAKDDEKARAKFLNIMNVQAERMGRLINDILSLSRIELNEHVQPREVADLTETFQFCLAALEPTAKIYESRVELDSPSVPLNAICDENEIGQVITNLIDNGLKYGNPKSTVKVTVKSSISQDEIAARDANDSANSLWLCMPQYSAERKYLCVRVENQGKGIEKRNMPRLCERFYRIDEASNSKQGTGLGLAIVKHIINRHGGGLRVDSDLGNSTTFSFILPQG